MDSFYGSAASATFTLKEYFESYDAMVAAFRQGASYTDVWYGEYCLISSKNRNHPDNGKVYKRGLDYQNVTTGGAIYIGDIVGSSSGTPFVQIGTIDEVSDMSTSTLEENSYRRYPVGLNEDGTVETNWQYNESTHSWSDVGGDIKKDFYFGEVNKSLVPGKTGSGDDVTYNDEIKYTWVNIRKDDEDADSWFYVGFEFPYMVTDYSIHHTSQYDPVTKNILDNAATIDRVDDASHPYYQHWEIGTPKGIKGDTLRSLRVIVPTESDVIYSSSAITVDPNSGLTKLGDPGYEGQKEDIDAQRQIVVFDYYIYDQRLNPSPIMIYLGDFNTITNIEVADDGTLTISYTHEDNTVYSKKIKWITDVVLSNGNGKNGGHFSVTYNNDSKSYETDITWIKGIEISEDGSVTYVFCGTDVDEEQYAGSVTPYNATTGKLIQSKFLKWVKDVSLTTGNGAEGGHFKLTFNNDAPAYETDLQWVKDIKVASDGSVTYVYAGASEKVEDKKVRWVKDVSLNGTTGQFKMVLNTGETVCNQTLDWVKDISINESDGTIVVSHTTGDKTSAARLKLLTSMETADNGVVTMYYNTTDSTGAKEKATIKKAGTNEDYKIQTIKSVDLATSINADKHFTVLYNTDSTAKQIGTSINYVQDMVVRPSDWHLFVLFDDITHRATANTLTKDIVKNGNLIISGTDDKGISWIDNTQVVGFMGDGYNNYGSGVYWRDYGTIKDQAGILIGLNVTKATVVAEGFSDIISYLNSKAPTGLTGEDNVLGGMSTKGKVVTYQPDDDAKSDKEFYAFDYFNSTWYYLGHIADTETRDATLIPNTEATVTGLKNLNTNGVAVITTSVEKSDTGIPQYWSKDYTGWA